MNEPAQKRYSLQILRGLAAVWVVAYHLEFLSTHYFQRSLGLRLINAGHLGVHLFFVLSGFVIYWVHNPDAGNAPAVRSYFLKRIARIYPLLFVLNTIKLAYMGFSGYGVRANKFDLGSIVGSYLLLPTTRNFLIDVTWSLAYEMWFYLGFGVLLLLGRKFLHRVGITYGLLVVVLNLRGIPALDGMAHFVFDPRVLEFMLGCGIAAALSRPVAWPKAGAIAAGGAGVILIVAGVTARLDERLAPLTECGYWGIAFASLLLGSLVLEKSANLSGRRFGVLLGDASYSIYLAHSLVLNAAALAVARFMPSPASASSLAALLGCGVLGILFGFACYYGIERPLHVWLRGWIQDGTWRTGRAGRESSHLALASSPANGDSVTPVQS